MRIFDRTSLAFLGLAALLVPVAAEAQTGAPAGYAPAPRTMAAPMAKPAAKPHAHRGKTLCASCAKKQEMAMTTRIVACAHSKNGVCPTCRTLLEMPGTVTMGAPAPAPAMAGAPMEAPGRALVSNEPQDRPGMVADPSAARAAVYDPSLTPEPTPIGLMQTNYAQPGMIPAAGPAGAAASSIPTASSLMPGHSLNGSGTNPAPYQHKPTSSKNPHIIGHLLGIKGIGSEWREQQAGRKTQAHASIPYNNEGTTINELPASVVYGNKH